MTSLPVGRKGVWTGQSDDPQTDVSVIDLWIELFKILTLRHREAVS